MSCKTKIDGKRRTVCIGDLDRRIEIQNRNITPPTFGGADFGEDFTKHKEVWALVATMTGRTIFNGVDRDVLVTHEFVIRYDKCVTSESWIRFKGQRFDILSTENLEERDEFIKMPCAVRGSEDELAASA